MARYKRARGFDVMFLTGTDEHGQKNPAQSRRKGRDPQQYVDDIVATIKDLWRTLNISNDRFIRTTDPYHVQSIQKIFKAMYDKGDIYKGEYEGLYCAPCESFWTETQAVDGKCPDCGRPVEKTKEEAYFFRLSAYQDKLIAYYAEHPDFVQPQSRLNEMINNFLKPGLEDLCVSRTSFDWGIPVSFDEKHVVYVWVDALSNYITALRLRQRRVRRLRQVLALRRASGRQGDRAVPHDHLARHAHVAGSAPAQKGVRTRLAAARRRQDVQVLRQRRRPHRAVRTLRRDAIRYFLLREIPFGSDGVYSNEALINRINADLANDLGNLAAERRHGAEILATPEQHERSRSTSR